MMCFRDVEGAVPYERCIFGTSGRRPLRLQKNLPTGKYNCGSYNFGGQNTTSVRKSNYEISVRSAFSAFGLFEICRKNSVLNRFLFF